MQSWKRGDGLAVATIAAGAMAGGWMTGLPASFDLGSNSTVTSAAVVEADAPAVDSRGVAFYASSIDGWWTATGDYGGRIRRDGSDLVLRAEQARIRFNTLEDPTVPTLKGVRLALAEETDLGWEIIKSGPLFPLERVALPGDDVWVEDMELRLPDVSNDELTGRWWVIVHELENPDGSTSLTYAHADDAVVDRFLGAQAEGC